MLCVSVLFVIRMKSRACSMYHVNYIILQNLRENCDNTPSNLCSILSVNRHSAEYFIRPSQVNL